MNKKELISQIRSKRSFLCVGLDPDYQKMPPSLRSPDGVVDFCKRIIDATQQYCVAFKPNIAFFEALGRQGWDVLYRVAEYLPNDCFTIADAKRADIGNSSRMYAKAFLEEMGFDSVTVAPYMGRDSVEPFLGFEDKWAILLALTSNSGSQDFQMIADTNGSKLYQEVMKKAASWGTPSNLMYVVGATHPEILAEVRGHAPDHFFLVPGVGAQGGDLKSVVESAMTDDIGLLVNSTRAIIYASSADDYAEAAGKKAAEYRDEMMQYL